MIWLFTIDGAAFLLIGLVVLATPSPVPALMDPPDERRALVPFKDTRRLPQRTCPFVYQRPATVKNPP
jgi:hypothetical protein